MSHRLYFYPRDLVIPLVDINLLKWPECIVYISYLYVEADGLLERFPKDSVKDDALRRLYQSRSFANNEYGSYYDSRTWILYMVEFGNETPFILSSQS
jgi:hypothetical protein